MQDIQSTDRGCTLQKQSSQHAEKRFPGTARSLIEDADKKSSLEKRTKTLHRYRPGIVALREIRRYVKSSELLIEKRFPGTARSLLEDADKARREQIPRY